MNKLQKQSKAQRYDKMVMEPKDDELGLFDKYNDIMAMVRNLIRKKQAKYVIDIGCGTANLCGELSKELCILGIDQNEEMIALAQQKYPNMNFKLGSFLEKINIEDKTDVVVTSFAFHILNDDEKKEAIQNIIEYLNDKGSILIIDYMFENKEKREQCKSDLLGNGKEELWEVIESKYYTILDEFADYIKSLGKEIRREHIVNYTWLIEIKNIV